MIKTDSHCNVRAATWVSTADHEKTLQNIVFVENCHHAENLTTFQNEPW